MTINQGGRTGRSGRRCAWLFLGSLTAATGAAHAADRTWGGTVDGDYYTAANWVGGVVPAVGDHITVDSGRPITEAGYDVQIRDGGTLRLSGAGTGLGKTQYPSSWRAPALWVGRTGVGDVRVENGANLVSRLVYLGGEAGSVGTVTLTGAGTSWDVETTEFNIGNQAGGGVVNVLDHAKLDYFGDLRISYGIGSNGAVTVDNATLKVTGLMVGDGATGVLNLRNGATATAVVTNVGYYRTTDGTANIDGPGTTLTNTRSTGVTDIGRYGRGEMNVTRGAAVINAGGAVVGPDTGHGTLRVLGDGSRFTAGGSIVVGSPSGTSTVGAGPVGDGSVQLSSGAVITSVSGVTLAGNSGLSFTADRDGDAGRLSGNTVAILGGGLSFHVASNFVPMPGTTFDLITATGGITGQFATFASDVPAELLYGPGTVSVRIVPEPAGLLAGVGALLLAGRRRRGG